MYTHSRNQLTSFAFESNAHTYLVLNLFVQNMHSTIEWENDFSKSKPKFFSAPEVKLLILSIFLSIIGVVTIGTYSSVIGDQSAYATRFLQYTNCLLCGNDPKCTMESASDHFRVASNAIGQLAYCLLFAVNIVFTLNASDISKISKVLCCACRHCKKTKGTTSSSATNPSPFTKSHSVATQSAANLADTYVETGTQALRGLHGCQLPHPCSCFPSLWEWDSLVQVIA